MINRLKAPRTERLKLKYDKLHSIFAFSFNLRRYMEAAEEAAKRATRARISKAGKAPGLQSAAGLGNFLAKKDTALAGDARFERIFEATGGADAQDVLVGGLLGTTSQPTLSTINRDRDVGKCTQVGRPPRTVPVRLTEQLP